MALETGINEDLRDLAEISSKYLEWYMHIVRKLMYPQETSLEQAFVMPTVFTDWLEKAKKAANMEEKVLQELEKNHNALLMLVQEHIEEVSKTRKPPAYAEFNVLVMIFEGFLDKLRRLEKQMMFQEGGFEALSGLKSAKAMKEDLKREMDRLARHGRPFSIALLQINNFNEITKTKGKKTAEEQISAVSEMIHKSLRSFDDAYYIENGEFVLSLKQAEISGGIRALERLEELLMKNNAKKDSEAITVSCYVAEPDPNDEIQDLLEYLRSDLSRLGDDSGNVLEYHDMSPLQRFVKGH